MSRRRSTSSSCSGREGADLEPLVGATPDDLVPSTVSAPIGVSVITNSPKINQHRNDTTDGAPTRANLDKRLGPDGRISDFSHDWSARLLKRLGFRKSEQVEKCVRGYDDDALSRVLRASRLGQTTRFEYMLLAGMGDKYVRRHVYAGEAWSGPSDLQLLEKFKARGVDVRDYDPITDVPGTGAVEAEQA